MNGQQIESMLNQIDENIDLSRDEAMRYIRSHQDELASQLATQGYAMVKTNAGDLRLSVEDLEAVAA